MYEANTWLIVLPCVDIKFWRWESNKLLYIYGYSGTEKPLLHLTCTWGYVHMCQYILFMYAQMWTQADACVSVSVHLFLWLTFLAEYLVASDSLCMFMCCALKLSVIHSPPKAPMALFGFFFYFAGKQLLPIGMLQGKRRACFQCQFICNKTTFTASPDK